MWQKCKGIVIGAMVFIIVFVSFLCGIFLFMHTGSLDAVGYFELIALGVCWVVYFITQPPIQRARFRKRLAALQLSEQYERLTRQRGQLYLMEDEIWLLYGLLCSHLLSNPCKDGLLAPYQRALDDFSERQTSFSDDLARLRDKVGDLFPDSFYPSPIFVDFPPMPDSSLPVVL